MKIFSGNAHKSLSENIAHYLNVNLGRITTTRFSDGEIRVSVDETARGEDVYIIQPTCRPVNDSLLELLIIIDAFKRASANKINVVIPYFGYARQDKKVKPREPITARLVANMITTAGADRVVTIDFHAEQLQGFFNIPVDHLYGAPIIARWILEQKLDKENLVIVSPDAAGVPRARILAEYLNTEIAIISKRRPEPNKVEISQIIGDVSKKTCLMIDDMIDTGGTIVKGAEALINNGAKSVIAACTHPVFSNNAAKLLQDSCLSKIVCLDTIPINNYEAFDKLVVLSAANILGEAIHRIHYNKSISTLFQL